MKKKIIIGTVGISLVLIAIAVYFVKNITEKNNPQKENSNQTIEVVSVEKVISAVGYYKGFLGIEGVVIKIDEAKNIFLLGCADACIVMPVAYKGQMPEAGREIIVYGEIKKQENGRYIFQGKEIKTR